VQAIEKGNYELTAQENFKEGMLKTAPKLFKEDCRINWKLTGQQVHNLIRGLSPYPGAWTELISPDGRKQILKIYKSSLLEENRACRPGELVIPGKSELCICSGEGMIEVLELQLAGKRKMKTDEFLRGLPVNEHWSVK
jgi:methionyl-tRNA formyltransferase